MLSKYDRNTLKRREREREPRYFNFGLFPILE